MMMDSKYYVLSMVIKNESKHFYSVAKIPTNTEKRDSPSYTTVSMLFANNRIMIDVAA